MKKNLLLIPFVIIILVLLGIGFFDFKTNKLQSSPNSTEIAEKAPSSIKNISQITLDVVSPQNNSTVKDGAIIVSGKTLPNADVFVNDKELKADAYGNFSTSTVLDEGPNIVVVAANDAAGNISEREIAVTFNPNF